jgi:hypothetical protein
LIDTWLTVASIRGAWNTLPFWHGYSNRKPINSENFRNAIRKDSKDTSLKNAVHNNKIMHSFIVRGVLDW